MHLQGSGSAGRPGRSLDHAHHTLRLNLYPQLFITNLNYRNCWNTKGHVYVEDREVCKSYCVDLPLAAVYIHRCSRCMAHARLGGGDGGAAVGSGSADGREGAMVTYSACDSIGTTRLASNPAGIVAKQCRKLKRTKVIRRGAKSPFTGRALSLREIHRKISLTTTSHMFHD